MKKIEVSDEVYAALQNRAAGFCRTPDEIISWLLNMPGSAPESPEPLVTYVVSAGFRDRFTDADKYLALLAWIAARHSADFSEFIGAQSRKQRYLSRSREEILDICRHNEARQIDGTQYWAIMNIDAATKRRFLARLLEFIGYHDAVIEFACSAIGMRRETPGTPALSLVA